MSSVSKTVPVAGKNGVVLTKRPKTSGPGYRTYEVYQRERVGESTEKIKPSQLISEEFRNNPYPYLNILRENYPCYRDWLSNCYWITQYDDVTSILADDANFQTRENLWYYGREGYGRDLREELPILEAYAAGYQKYMESIAEEVVDDLIEGGTGDLATQLAARYPLELLSRILGIPSQDIDEFASLYWKMKRGVSWDTELNSQGSQAMNKLAEFLTPVFLKRKENPEEDLVSAIAVYDEKTTVNDLVVTLLEGDHETLHGTLANLFFNLLFDQEALEMVRSDRRILKLAYLETLRHSQPVISVERYTLHEVERFGRLLPAGAQIICSAAAANRDPRIFEAPDKFIPNRKDLCQREPRGMYRADGLASGIAFGLGKPSIHPAIPDDRPISLYAITRDLAVIVSEILLSKTNNITLIDGSTPFLTSLRLGEMRTCWHLPVKFNKQ